MTEAEGGVVRDADEAAVAAACAVGDAADGTVSLAEVGVEETDAIAGASRGSGAEEDATGEAACRGRVADEAFQIMSTVANHAHHPEAEASLYLFVKKIQRLDFELLAKQRHAIKVIAPKLWFAYSALDKAAAKDDTYGAFYSGPVPSTHINVQI